nr:excalibur calcium-binding domain-containing protein [Mycolicibacterium komanii]
MIVAAFVVAATAAGAATASADTYYKNCSAAREAGVAPIMQGEDGYAPHLDRDGDGIACE